MATALKIFAGLIVLAGGFYLYVEFEAARVGAVSPLGYLVHILIVTMLAVVPWVLARRIDRKKAQANDIAGTF